MPELNESLSEREQEILRLVATGAANKEIARQLVISPNTVKVHLRNIFAKIGVSSRTEATLYALKIGLVRPEAVREPAAETPDEDSGSIPVLKAEPEPAASQAALAPARKARRLLPAWVIGLLILAALVSLAGTAMIGLRLIARPTPAPTVAAEAAVAAQAATQANSRWSEKAALPSPRRGMGIVEYENELYALAGETKQGIDGAVLRYDQAENSWSALASKPTPVTDIQAALVGEKIYVPGGRLADGTSTDRLEVYNPRSDTWESKAPLPVPLSAYALASFEGQLYLFGGKNGSQYSADVYVYNPAQDRWTRRAAMSSPRAYAQAVESNGGIHVIGGYDGHQALKTNEAYIPARDASGDSPWKTLAPLPEGRYAMGGAHLAGLIYLVGGLGENDQPAAPVALQYNLQADQWVANETPPVKVGANVAVIASGSLLYILGGETSQGLSATNLSYQAIYTISVPILRNDKAP